MKIGIPKERREYEKRVAAVPDTVRKYIGLGFDVTVETGAGEMAGFPDEEYREAGAVIAADATETLKDADLVLKVQRPMTPEDGGINEAALLKDGAVLVAMLQPTRDADAFADYARRNITCFAMELMPRITRAQSMDVLSSQSNLAGYRAVIEAAYEFNRGMPMMMTAAGTVAPARVFVFGAGVAGLQAIATAKRLGAVVSATDVRPAVKEQVESLAAKFIAPDIEESGEGEGGYAREMSDEYKRRQAEMISETMKKQDIAITTALIPGRRAPVLITREHIASMRPGSVIVDLAVEQGGNVEGSEIGKIVEVDGVKIIGHANMASRIATDASALYARNLLNFLTPQMDKETGTLKWNWDDETVSGTALTRDGAVVHPILKNKGEG